MRYPTFLQILREQPGSLTLCNQHASNAKVASTFKGRSHEVQMSVLFCSWARRHMMALVTVQYIDSPWGFPETECHGGYQAKLPASKAPMTPMSMPFTFQSARPMKDVICAALKALWLREASAAGGDGCLGCRLIDPCCALL